MNCDIYVESIHNICGVCKYGREDGSTKKDTLEQAQSVLIPPVGPISLNNAQRYKERKTNSDHDKQQLFIVNSHVMWFSMTKSIF